MAGQKLIELIQKQAKNQISKGLELATVISEYPDLIIQIDNMPMNLGKNFLIIPERLINIIPGDRLSVMPLYGGHKYVILDKVVILDG